MKQESLLHQCEQCREWHDDGDWMLCHVCADPAFRAWYVGGLVNYENACAIFAGLLAKLMWRPA